MRKATLAATAILVLPVTPAAAQYADTAENVAPGPAVHPGDQPDPGTAQLISLGATVTSLGLAWLNDGRDHMAAIALGATMAAPAAGYFYGGRSMRGLLGVGVRLGGVGIAAAGGSGCFAVFSDDPAERCELILLGGLIVLTSAIYDLATVDNSVRDHNARRSGRVGVTPYLEPSGGAGLLLTVRH